MTQEPENNQREEQKPQLIIVGAPDVGRTEYTMRLIEKAKELGKTVLVLDSLSDEQLEEMMKQKLAKMQFEDQFLEALKDGLPNIKPYQEKKTPKEQTKPIDAILKKGRRRKW